MLLDQVQILQENGQNKFAVIAYDEFCQLKHLLSSEEQLEDLMDLLHMQKIKNKQEPRMDFEEVKKELGL